MASSPRGWERFAWGALGALAAALLSLWLADEWGTRQEGLRLIAEQRIARSGYAAETRGKVEELEVRLADVERRINALERRLGELEQHSGDHPR